MFIYTRQNCWPRLLSMAAAISMLGSCGSDDLTGPTEGTIKITTNTSGSDPDTDGYTASIDGGTPQAIGIIDTLILPDIEPGDHSIVLGGVAPNCTVGFGVNLRTATVPVADTARVAFAITCEAINPPGGGDPVI